MKIAHALVAVTAALGLATPATADDAVVGSQISLWAVAPSVQPNPVTVDLPVDPATNVAGAGVVSPILSTTALRMTPAVR